MTRIKEAPPVKGQNAFKKTFEVTQLEDAFIEYLKAKRHYDCRLVLSLHDYSKGIYLEFHERPLKHGEDFIIQSDF